MTRTAPIRKQRWHVLATHIPAGGAEGGMVRYATEIIGALARRDDIEIHPHVRPAAVPFVVETLGVAESNVRVVRADRILLQAASECAGLGLPRSDCDVVLGTKHFVPFGSPAFRVLAVHDVIPIERRRDFGALKRTFLPAAYRRCLLDADLLACISNASRTRLLGLLPSVGDRAVVVTLASSDRLLRAAPEPLRPLTGRRFALVVGDLSPRKNTSFLLGLWPSVVAEVSDAVLALVGPPGWGVDGELPMLEELERTGSVVRLGHVTDGALRWAYENARVTLNASVYEGFGLPVAEAASFGSPIVISPDAAMVEASGGRAEVRSLEDPGGWITAIVDSLRRTRSETRTSAAAGGIRRWDDVADELVGRVRAHQQHGTPRRGAVWARAAVAR